MILALLLAALAPTDFGQSLLIDPEATHEWQTLHDADDFAFFWDKKSLGSQTIRDREYPVVLLRFIAKNKKLPMKFEDRLIAVDCERSQQAIVSRRADPPLPPEIVYGDEPMPRFVALSERDRVVLDPVFQAACGEDS